MELVKKEKRVYRVNIPKRMKDKGMHRTKVLIKSHYGEYMYMPRKFTFAMCVGLTHEELNLISKELKRLNKKK